MGPTACGKSSLATHIARQYNGVIVNCDSCQIYKEAPLLTARPQEKITHLIPHFLYGFHSITQNYSVHDWCQDASKLIIDFNNKNIPVILVGGTGLYFKALTQGISYVPPIDQDIRDGVRAMSTQEIYNALKKEDPFAIEKFHANDTQRLARCLEVIRSTKRPLNQWHQEKHYFIPHTISLEPYIIMPPRESLYKKIHQRFDEMIKMGALDEVKTLLERNIPISYFKKVIGLSELADHLKGHTPLDQAIENAKKATRHYAKRQYTWFRHQL